MKLTGVALIFLLSACAVHAEEGQFQRRWSYVSETSAVLYWQTPDMADQRLGLVEYGPTAKLGLASSGPDEPRWAHLHFLSGLESGKTVYCRMVLIDSLGRRTESEILELHPARRENAIRVPEEVAGPPYLLDRPGATYILTRDITVNGTAFEIRGADVTLDLDGHTVVFGNDTAEQVYGVRFANTAPAVLCNGRIVQGARSREYSAAVTSRKRPHPLEIFGIQTDVHGKCAYPADFSALSDSKIHHNHFYSRTTELESRHYPGNALLLAYISAESQFIHIHDNLFTEGCHRGLHLRDGGRGRIEADHNDIRHHQQYVNGYALIPCQGADIHHNLITSTGRSIHLNAGGVKVHDNRIDTRGHVHLDDLPAGSRPFQLNKIELHGIKFEGRNARDCQVYNNFVRITQFPPADSGGYGDPVNKRRNGVYVRSSADSLAGGRLFDSRARWEKDRWKGYRVRYSESSPPVLITGNDSTSLSAEFKGRPGGWYSIYMPWEFVPPTPLNLGGNNPEAMNDIHGNTFIAVTHYRDLRHGGYGDTGNWASCIMFVSMNRGAAPEGKYNSRVYGNVFMGNDLFLNSYEPVNMTVKIENNTFRLLNQPFTTGRPDGRLRNLGPELEKAVLDSGNKFEK